MYFFWCKDIGAFECDGIGSVSFALLEFDLNEVLGILERSGIN